MLAATGSVHEQEFVRSFIQKERRERCLFLLSDLKRRSEFTTKLAHFNWFDDRYSTFVAGSIAHTSLELISLLKLNGAGPHVWVISDDCLLDGRMFPLQEAMNAIWGSSTGSVLSCVPGKLAFYRGEAMKSELLLKHP